MACRWRIYYGDGSTFDSEAGGPEDAPAYDVQTIVQADNTPEPANVGRQVLRLHDWYYWRVDEGVWVGGDLMGIIDLLLAREPIIALCQGRRIPVVRYNAIVARAMSDPDFPRKSAGQRGETP